MLQGRRNCVTFRSREESLRQSCHAAGERRRCEPTVPYVRFPPELLLRPSVFVPLWRPPLSCAHAHRSGDTPLDLALLNSRKRMAALLHAHAVRLSCRACTALRRMHSNRLPNMEPPAHHSFCCRQSATMSAILTLQPNLPMSCESGRVDFAEFAFQTSSPMSLALLP